MTRPQTQILVPRFFGSAGKLRKEFEARFSNPFGGGGERFVWDYWHIPQQYTLLRTPAYLFFPPELYRDFHERLVKWGREKLGCHDVTPTWLSCYVDGCEQKQHVDRPHGPWAFVYSLTPWEIRKFTGGETFLSSKKRSLIQPCFNQLAVFDPRIPHGVKTVKGLMMFARVGSSFTVRFVNPRPFIQGPVTPRDLQERIEGLMEELVASKVLAKGAGGILSFRFRVAASGKVSQPQLLSHTLRPTRGSQAPVDRAIAQLMEGIRDWDFPKKRAGSVITLPLQFE